MSLAEVEGDGKGPELFSLPTPTSDPVRFRDLLPGLPRTDYTHGIYPYPARLLRNIPRHLLSTADVVSGIDYVVDPFCGSGTVLLEALLAGLPSVGMDSSPVAALISSVKTDLTFGEDHRRAVREIISASKSSRKKKALPNFVLRWIDPTTESILSRLMHQYDELPPGPPKNYVAIGIASLVRRHAQMDPRISVPVRAKNPISPASWGSLREIFRKLEARCDTIATPEGMPRAGSTVMNVDSRSAEAWSSGALNGKGLLFTSPPYGTAQKYVRAMSLEAGVLGYASMSGTRALDIPTIGRERLAPWESSLEQARLFEGHDSLLKRIHAISPERAFAYSAYLAGIQEVVGRASGIGVDRAIIVSGDNMVTGVPFPTRRYIAKIMMDNGYGHDRGWRDKIAGRTLLTARKGGNIASEFEYVDLYTRR